MRRYQALKYMYAIALLGIFKIAILSHYHQIRRGLEHAPMQNDWQPGNAATKVVHLHHASLLLDQVENYSVQRHRNDNNSKKKNGESSAPDWFGAETEDFHMLAYSAIYDNRTLSGRPIVPYIVVMGVCAKIQAPIYCRFWNNASDRGFTAPTKLVYTMGNTIPRLVFSFVIHCPLHGKTDHIPKYVTLDQNETRIYREPLFKIPVELPIQPKKEKLDLAVCLTRVYALEKWSVDPIKPDHVIEWIELNKLLGVQRVIAYNHSMNRQIEEVFQYYAKLGFVEILSYGPEALPNHKPYHEKPSADTSLNDCLYRYMYSFKKMVNIDIDEIIASYTIDSLSELMRQEAEAANTTVRQSQFTFANQRYFLDDPKVHPGPLRSEFAIRHIPEERDPQGRFQRPKTIADPNLCILVNPHWCVHHYHGSRQIMVPPERAVSFHYKSCHYSRQDTKPKNCTAEFRSSVQDKSMQRFSKVLRRNVQKVREDIVKLEST